MKLKTIIYLTLVRDAVLFFGVVGLALWKAVELLCAFWSRVLVVLLLCSTSLAGWPDNRVVKLADGGSGAFVRFGDGVAILSCAHRTATTNVPIGEQIGYRCGDDSQGVAIVRGRAGHEDRGGTLYDGAILSASHVPAGVVPLTISEQPLNRGEQVWICGFPLGGRFVCRTAAVIEDGGALLLVGGSTPGESGGPILNRRGELVGTLTGCTTDNRETLCCARGVLAELCRRVQLAWCPGGVCPQQFRPQANVVIRPPQAAPPQVMPPQVRPPQPQPPADWKEPFATQQAEVKKLQTDVAALQQQAANSKPCECGDCCEKLRAEFTQKIETLAAAQVTINNELAAVQQMPLPTPNYDAIAAEVAKRLPPINMRVNPQAAYQPVKLGQYVTLPLDKLPAH